MALSSPAFLRGNPLLLKVPPYLSLLCVVVGVAWLLLLPLNEYSRHTYVSENALLPGQVHTYFAGSDQNVFRAYLHEVDAIIAKEATSILASNCSDSKTCASEKLLAEAPRNSQIEDIFRAADLKVARQKYEYESSMVKYAGENIYAILHAPRGDATEAIVLVAAWKNMEESLNRSGVALLLTLARYFKRWSLWSKDIIFLVTPDSKAGPQAWVDAYHDAHMSNVASLPLKSGALQGAVVIDYPFDHRFESIHIVYDGVNGQLPNLDLFNTIVSIASHQMGIGVSLQQMWKHTDNYKDRLQAMLRGMLRQGLGHGSGPHSSFIPYHVDAVTLQPFGDGWQDEMAMGRVIESTFRSLNNLLEHLHQSFFFYLLMHASRFVSIGTYLPSAMLVAVNFTIMAIFLWVRSGHPSWDTSQPSKTVGNEPLEIIEKDGAKALVPVQSLQTEERELFLPIAIVIGTHFLGLVPLYTFNHLNPNLFPGSIESFPWAFRVSEFVFWLFSISSLALPFATSAILKRYAKLTVQQYQLIKAFSLLLLGMFLSSLATLNFSLAFLIGLLAVPLTYIRPLPDSLFIKLLLSALLGCIAPPVVIYAGTRYWGIGLGEFLEEAAFGWDVWGMHTQVVVWCVWWPAWLAGAVILLGTPEVAEKEVKKSEKAAALIEKS